MNIKSLKSSFLSGLCFLALVVSVRAQSSYFPPASGGDWETVTPSQLGWCQEPLDTVLDYLEKKNTKGFIILKDGKIAVEKYYGTFTKDSAWYWASAGKSLTAMLVGIAQEKSLLNIDDKTSKYLGHGWTTAPAEKEDLITIRHQLTMTTGLDDNVPDDNCLTPSCLTYKADAGTRWAYYNAPYRLVQDVLEEATGKTMNKLVGDWLYPTTGITGLWFDYIFYSNTRSMARFGLLALAKGEWNAAKVLGDTSYFRQMTTTSQEINKSYGYLWWLNGKGSFMLPETQIKFNTNLIPTAPKDLFAGLGKNDQKVYVVPSMGLVVVRLGNPTGLPAYALTEFDKELWERLMKVFCTSGIAEKENTDKNSFLIYPNPVENELRISGAKANTVIILNTLGQPVKKITAFSEPTIDISDLKAGMYFVRCGDRTTRFVKW